MLTIAQREYSILAALLTIFTLALIPALLTSRADVRDGLRKQDITYLKRSLESFYNEHEFYPPSQGTCIVSTNPTQWSFIEALPHDVREQQGFIYRYCVTAANDTGATGYFLEAQLEVDLSDQRSFDEDELRKFHYRILHEDGKTLYRVCGGEEIQCQH